MAAQCKNYMEQYSRTKSIREINKTRNSYKQLLQNSKTRQNSSTTTNLKISDKKRSSQKQKQKLANKNIEQFHIENCSSLVEPAKNSNNNENVPVLSSTQNISSIINISYGKLNSKMKLKVTADKNIRSMSSQEQLLKYQNSVVVSSMADIGIGLSNKKKPKLVTLTSCHNPNNSTTKKYKNYNELTSISQHDHQNSYSNHKQRNDHDHEKSRSISKSHNNSVTNTKYGLQLGHEAAYRSIKKQIQNNQNNVEIITLNSSMLMSKDRRDTKADGLDQVYHRVKLVLQNSQQKQKQWQQQRTYYQQKIKQLEKQLSQAQKRSSIINKPNYSNYNSIIKQELSVKSSNRTNFN